jgi:hypothetical protein
MLSEGVAENWISPKKVLGYVDNVLLELILALEFNHAKSSQGYHSAVFPCKFIMPVFVDDLFSKQDNLSREVARDTMSEATRILQKYGIRPSCEYSPYSVFTALCEFQGMKLYVDGKLSKEQALDAVVKELIIAVTMCIQQSSVFIDDFKAHHPRARELCDWLHTRNLSSYSGVIARHGITSVHALSLLDVSSAIPILAKDCALSCGQSRMQATVCLSRAVAMAKGSDLSLPLSARFNRFVDTEASALSALFSSCGCDAALAKHQILIFLLFLSLLSAILGTASLKIFDQPVLSISVIVNPLFWFIFSAMLFCVATWPIAFGGSIFRVPSTEFKPRKIAVVALLFFPFMSTIIIVYIKTVYFEDTSFRHSILCESALKRGILAVSFDTCYLYEMFVIFPVQCIAFCTSGALLYAKQEFAFRSYVISALAIVSVFLGFVEMIAFENLKVLRIISGGMLVAMFCLLCVFEGLNMLSKRKASKLLKDVAEKYTDKWQKLMETVPGGQSDAKNLSEYIENSFAQVAEGLVSNWFNRRPHVTQEHSSIDDLFEDVELVDVAFQELIRCWLKVGMPRLLMLCDF